MKLVGWGISGVLVIIIIILILKLQKQQILDKSELFNLDAEIHRKQQVLSDL